MTGNDSNLRTTDYAATMIADVDSESSAETSVIPVRVAGAGSYLRANRDTHARANSGQLPVPSYGYVIASLLANLFSITFAFVGYKWFVFKTKGNYLREWIRYVGVYGVSMILSAAALPLVVGIIRHHPGHDRSGPYIAGAIVLLFSVVFSFFGHRHISFADGL